MSATYVDGEVATAAGPERDVPGGPVRTYRLSYGRPDDARVGWTLLVRPEAARRWSIRVPLHLGLAAFRRRGDALRGH